MILEFNMPVLTHTAAPHFSPKNPFKFLRLSLAFLGISSCFAVLPLE
jgi:hypothetical protein